MCEKCQKRIKEEGLQNKDQLQSWFTQHFARFLDKKLMRLIGWDEILDGNLPFPESTVVISYRGVESLRKAASLGHNVIMCLSTHYYLDYFSRSTSISAVSAWAKWATTTNQQTALKQSCTITFWEFKITCGPSTSGRELTFNTRYFHVLAQNYLVLIV